jgi:protein-disulfide isomerase
MLPVRPAPRRRPSAPTLTGALLALFLAGGCGNNGDAPAPTPDPGPAAGAGEPEEIIDLATLGHDDGDLASAPVRILEFSDFGCIFCARFHNEDYDILHDEFVVGGDVAWKYIPIAIGGFPNGELAAVTAECMADQGHFREMRSLLYRERDRWIGASGADEVRLLFEGYVEAVGGDVEAWDTCLEQGEAAERIHLQNRVAAELGVTGTPTFIIQGFPVQGAPTLPDFQEALRQLVEEVRRAGEDAGDDEPGG